MHFARLFPSQDRRFCEEDSGNQAAANTDFGGMEFPRKRSLGRNQYVELEIRKPKSNGASTKLPANQKPCEKMTEAIVMDGGNRGHVVKVCVDPACRVHHPDTPSPQQVERERAEERKRIEKEKLAITTRHRVLANNALALADLDCLVVATNTQFSNPTRDWVKAWQSSHPKPKIKLWDHSQLERFLSRHPDVVLRLFSEALSIDGRLTAMESRFWNKLEFVAPKTLTDLWKARHELNLTAGAMFAVIANEMANGSVVERAWAASISPESVAEVLTMGLYNVTYLAVRSSNAGVDQQIIFRALAYLILAALTHFPAEKVTHLIFVSINRGDAKPLPSEVQEMLLRPLLRQLMGEMQDVCSSDCRRILTDPSTLVESNELDNYWFRLEDRDIEEPPERRLLRIEKGAPTADLRPTGRNVVRPSRRQRTSWL
jgi:hypothetical protein